ncbi:3-deoxy-7-phosphoheptulonate synthase [Acetobacterium wieringae]|jgi:3-deoxy-7-phosphoheptulonate synthase|uniref:3-deoxy-7-phosphoheptulonate synthase n=1 Tax=Acetobacterium wieringae TaxID=52694 RepID=A0A1F2PIE3_9FIRM|nr:MULTISPECIES: 3-deoxy-7-phosphoheptulonate synthase [Acetobacterium]HAZ05935.1 3-deoxy-7-phosphoheptulonate synthase [Acetobacterium sp.]OFV71103.1 phospho-2-dehydro-3-deoxyheptonate aldolase [Acetobacterium wieringae]OXS26277.1 MAG: 3-deoxy-7-phosphoheptulonate synthase [Acetobacterium sp. MES1]TYC84223.1 3-deoxy-7-phosphoheptulonate synthase [Acetobacterium wieringae]URN84024.1 3-deoxy-7-phosphoheptulonate synthase [Acetobacterium wieringae]
MIIVVKPNTKEEDIQRLIKMIETQGLNIHYSKGVDHTILGIVGDTTLADVEKIRSNRIVENVLRVQEPYKKANRLFHPDDTIINVKGRKIGEGTISVMAGPCSVESEEQVVAIARSVKASGATFLRGGAFKPRTSPYAFQGLGYEGLELLKIARKETGLPIVSELMSLEHLQAFEDVDIIQVGARNMQNFDLLRELGKIDKPILLKRGMSSTMQEFLMSAEYIMKEGNDKVILCERGIRTFETATRNTLDISCIPVLKQKSHLPIIIDPSHATGLSWTVEALTKAAIAAGADGVMIEVHNNPEEALCDGEQSITPEQFHKIMITVKKYAEFENKVM